MSNPNSEFEVIVLPPKSHINIHPEQFGGELKPVKLFVFVDGAIDNTASYMWVMTNGEKTFIAQISAAMLQAGLQAAQIIRPEPSPRTFEGLVEN